MTSFEDFIALEVVMMVLAGTIAALAIMLFQEMRRNKKNAYQDLQSIIHSPHRKGELGEAIVRLALAQLPKGSVIEQFHHPDVPGRPDFAVKMDGKYLIIDSKFTTAPEIRHLVKRGMGLTKYVSPKVTYPFVLMWIPEPAWEALPIEDFGKLIENRIIPCTTSGLVSSVHMISYMFRVLGIRDMDDVDVEDKIGDIMVKRDAIEKILEKAHLQLSNGFNNVTKARSSLGGMKTD